MPVLNLTAADFGVAYQGLLPQGRIWPREQGTVQGQTLAVLMPTWARLVARDNNLLVDSFPATAVELLPEWEATLGLPDPCAGPAPTIAQRQAQVVARMAGRGGQSVPYFVGYAAQLGYAITVTEFLPALADIACADDGCNDPAWAHAWQVTSAGTVVTDAAADESYADDPLATWGGGVLECELREIAPAHTVLTFAYTGAQPAAVWGDVPGWGIGAWGPA